jgi:Bacterial mobilisation protein (MobC)
MCGSKRFHRRFSSIDYGASGGLCACEFRGIFSGTLTVTLGGARRALAQLRQIKCLAWLELRGKKERCRIGNRLLLLNNGTHVKADQFIVGRVSSETKARLRALAKKELLSESALLRRLVELVLRKAGLSPILTESPSGARSRRGARLMIRLRPDDQILLRERAAARGMPPATYVSVLTRAHLRSLAPLPQEELLALKRTLAELGSIGRNLNQIARAANQGQLVVSPGRDDLTAMLRVCGTLRDSLKRVLLANLKSWEQGSP